jgi:hypothetical protein
LISTPLTTPEYLIPLPFLTEEGKVCREAQMDEHQNTRDHQEEAKDEEKNPVHRAKHSKD